MIEGDHSRLSVTRQCRLVGLARSTAYYRPKGFPEKDATLCNRIDEIYTDYPFFGSRQMRDMLRREGWRVGRRRIQRLMRLMGLEAQCPKPNLSRPAKGHKVYPYLMKSMQVDRPNQAWCSDITYIRMEQGFMYLVAVMDWHSRKVLSWELSNTLDSDFCVNALERAIWAKAAPEVFNTDQGSRPPWPDTSTSTTTEGRTLRSRQKRPLKSTSPAPERRPHELCATANGSCLFLRRVL